jgi:hypothetical protein
MLLPMNYFTLKVFLPIFITGGKFVFGVDTFTTGIKG